MRAQPSPETEAASPDQVKILGGFYAGLKPDESYGVIDNNGDAVTGFPTNDADRLRDILQTVSDAGGKLVLISQPKGPETRSVVIGQRDKYDRYGRPIPGLRGYEINRDSHPLKTLLTMIQSPWESRTPRHGEIYGPPETTFAEIKRNYEKNKKNINIDRILALLIYGESAFVSSDEFYAMTLQEGLVDCIPHIGAMRNWDTASAFRGSAFNKNSEPGLYVGESAGYVMACNNYCDKVLKAFEGKNTHFVTLFKCCDTQKQRRAAVEAYLEDRIEDFAAQNPEAEPWFRLVAPDKLAGNTRQAVHLKLVHGEAQEPSATSPQALDQPPKTSPGTVEIDPAQELRAPETQEGSNDSARELRASPDHEARAPEVQPTPRLKIEGIISYRRFETIPHEMHKRGKPLQGFSATPGTPDYIGNLAKANSQVIFLNQPSGSDSINTLVTNPRNDTTSDVYGLVTPTAGTDIFSHLTQIYATDWMRQIQNIKLGDIVKLDPAKQDIINNFIANELEPKHKSIDVDELIGRFIYGENIILSPLEFYALSKQPELLRHIQNIGLIHDESVLNSPEMRAYSEIRPGVYFYTKGSPSFRNSRDCLAFQSRIKEAFKGRSPHFDRLLECCKGDLSQARQAMTAYLSGNHSNFVKRNPSTEGWFIKITREKQGAQLASLSPERQKLLKKVDSEITNAIELAKDIVPGMTLEGLRYLGEMYDIVIQLYETSSGEFQILYSDITRVKSPSYIRKDQSYYLKRLTLRNYATKEAATESIIRNLPQALKKDADDLRWWKEGRLLPGFGIDQLLEAE